MAVVTITKDNFEAEVLGCKIPVVLDFWAEWCEPCKMQSTVIEELAAELDGKVKFGKVNVDEEASLALNYQIMSIPTLVVMHVHDYVPCDFLAWYFCSRKNTGLP